MGERRISRKKKPSRARGERTGGGGLSADIADEIAFISSGGFTSESSQIRPTGRAPRGQGAEFAARRTIANTMDRLDRRISSLQRQSARVATRQTTFEISRAKGRLAIVKQIRGDVGRIARGPGDWTLKRDLIRSVAAVATNLP